MIQYILFFIVVVVIYFYYSFVYKPRKLYNFYGNTLEALGYKVLKLPFKPFKAPFIQRYNQNFKKHKDTFYQDKYVTQTYDIMLHNLVDQVIVDLINPQLIRQFLSMQKIFLFPKRKIYIANMKRLLGDGVAFSEGQQWKSKRKIITSIFTFDFLKSIIPNISKICDQQFDKAQQQWKLKNPQSKDTRVFILELFFNIASSILMVSFFGMSSKNLKIEGKTPCQFINEALHLANQQATQPLGYLLGPWIFNLGLKQRDRKANHIVKAFRSFASQLVKKKIQQIKRQKKLDKPKSYNDLIQALVYYYNLGQQSNENKSQDKYTIDDVVDQFCTLLAAATDTTSHFFMMMVYYIVQTPQVQSRLRQQIDQVFKTQEDINYQNLKKMKYIDCIQEQVTRIYGPGTGVFFRQASKDTQIHNIPILKGTGMSIKPFRNHYDPEFFQDPLNFKPQRWQKTNNLHPYTVLGFSGGPRNCLGKHLAMLETKIGLIKLFKRYKNIKLEIPKQKWQMKIVFLYTPQRFMTILNH